MSKRMKQEMAVQIPQTFQDRFGQMGYELAKTITCFSLDLIGLISSYIMYELPKTNGQPHLWRKIDHQVNNKKCTSNYVDVMFHPIHRTIWFIMDERTQVLDMDANELFCIEQFQGNLLQRMYNSCGFYQDQVFFTTKSCHLLHVFNDQNGRFMREITLITTPYETHYGIRIVDQNIIIAKLDFIGIYDLEGKQLMKKSVPGAMGSIHVTKDKEILTTTRDSELPCIQVEYSQYIMFISHCFFVCLGIWNGRSMEA